MTTKTYQLKDFCCNCMSLADYFAFTGHFAQAQYLLSAAYSLLPEDQEKRKMLRASV